MDHAFRILLVADTHLGFDEPLHPRVERRRRGADFLASFERALEPALRGEVHAVVNGGDLFAHSHVTAAVAERGFRPIARVAAAGVPVFIVPGNHERSRIPFPIFAVHRNIHVFDRPRTFVVPVAGADVAFSGFPFAAGVRARFPSLLAETGWTRVAAGTRLLCIHQAVEGARAGTPEFLFDRGSDVVRGRDLLAGFTAVLSGHIHRGQRLSMALDGRPLAAPVYYPGSVERTSFAERLETKGYLVLDIRGGRVERHHWNPLPSRPMCRVTFESADELRRTLAALPPDAIVRIDCADESLTADRVRALTPAGMNVDLAYRRIEGMRVVDE